MAIAKLRSIPYSMEQKARLSCNETRQDVVHVTIPSSFSRAIVRHAVRSSQLLQPSRFLQVRNCRRPSGPSPLADGRLFYVEVPGRHAHQRLVLLERDAEWIAAAGDDLTLPLQHLALHDDPAVAHDEMLFGMQ